MFGLSGVSISVPHFLPLKEEPSRGVLGVSDFDKVKRFAEENPGDNTEIWVDSNGELILLQWFEESDHSRLVSQTNKKIVSDTYYRGPIKVQQLLEKLAEYGYERLGCL